MIERQNWLDIKAYLAYSVRTLQVDAQTEKRKRAHLRHLLEWADRTEFTRARSIDPTFPVYLLRTRNDGKAGQLSSETMRRACEEARRFFTWARSEYPNRYRPLTESWLMTLRPDRAHSAQSELRRREVWEFEDILKIAVLEPESMTEKRDIAAVCFLYLSGMRIDAFITLPLECIDIHKGEVRQLPGKGVRTKNHKAAITYLLNGEDIQPILAVVSAWDDTVKKVLEVSSYWYPFLDSGGNILPHENRIAGRDRASLFRKGLRRLCKRAGVVYRSPHKLRHGHAVYAIKQAKTIAQLKAISQNLMHKSLTITDGLYGVLTSQDVGANIRSLGRDMTSSSGASIDIDALKSALELLISNQGRLA